jgi:hypothetical protein
VRAWEKIAVVSDIDWIRFAGNAFRFAMPAHMKVFSNRQLAAARAWIKT